ncbi:uncharacterized protein LOC141685387 [Apium graveolens]|uniref:uncharacterized protein LOC141685387 n=1 Tax=Apium graveolens TaxID=4045 RepID=UPI003D7B78A0
MTFSTEDYEDVIPPHENPLIINPLIGQNKIWKVLVNTGSSANILFHKTYCMMNLAGEQLGSCNEAPLYAFGGYPIQFKGTITLPVLLGKLPYTVEKPVKFYVVQIESPYNAILGRPFLSTFEAVESIPHLKFKFPTEKGVGEMRGNQKTARIIMLEDLEKDHAYGKPDETGKRKRTEAEPSGNRETLNIELENFGADLSSLISEPAAENEEVELYACHSGKMVLSFLDVFSGYHQIAMNDKDVPKTTFITPKGTYAYIKMPFGLMNAGATFQQMVNKVFKEQIGRNMEAYVDDMIVKSLFQVTPRI